MPLTAAGATGASTVLDEGVDPEDGFSPPRGQCDGTRTALANWATCVSKARRTTLPRSAVAGRGSASA